VNGRRVYRYSSSNILYPWVRIFTFWPICNSTQKYFLKTTGFKTSLVDHGVSLRVLVSLNFLEPHPLPSPLCPCDTHFGGKLQIGCFLLLRRNRKMSLRSICSRTSRFSCTKTDSRELSAKCKSFSSKFRASSTFWPWNECSPSSASFSSPSPELPTR